MSRKRPPLIEEGVFDNSSLGWEAQLSIWTKGVNRQRAIRPKGLLHAISSLIAVVEQIPIVGVTVGKMEQVISEYELKDWEKRALALVTIVAVTASAIFLFFALSVHILRSA